MKRLLVLLLAAAVTQAAEPVVEPALPIDVIVPQAPGWVPARDGLHALYELHITNYRSLDLELLAIEVNEPGQATPLRSFQGSDLEEILSRPGTRLESADKRRIHGGETAVAYIELVQPAGARPVRTIRQRLLVRRAPGENQAPGDKVYALDTETVAFAAAPIRLAPPLRGGGWIAANGMANTSEHRRALITAGGRARIAQRYAIDFMQLGPNGRFTRDDGRRNESFFAYGVPLLAVADGRVAGIKDGIIENVPFEKPAVEITLETLCGNYLLLDIGAGYAVYAHVKPGSFLVKVGERVRRGQPLALLGNSGNSDAPHLHFHVTDRPAPIAAEGIPFVFDEFRTSGNIADLDAFVTQGRTYQPTWTPPRPARNSAPLNFDVIDFK
jgi:murein DD-endopeptidase MepM/ murein hydrolase activator NlpD